MTAPSTHACTAKPALHRTPRVVSVNGTLIERGAIAREMQNHQAGKPTEAWLGAARALVVRELLLQEARRLGILAQPHADADGRRETDEEAIVRQLVEHEVHTPQVSDDECRRYYANNKARFRAPALYGVRHILLAAAPDDRAARAAARAKALELIADLRTRPGAFAALADAHSACPSGRVGGSLGQLGPGQTVPEFERALGALPVGEIGSEPVETRYGLHVVCLDQRVEGRQLPFDLVKARIAGWLEERARRTAIRQFIVLLAGRADIEGVALDANPSPLVQ